MVRPIPAVGLASALVQIIDFSINTLRKDHPIYQPTSLSTTLVENAAFLQDIIHNLYRLTDLIDQSELKKLHISTRANKAAKKLSEAAQQLLKLSDLTKELTTPLIDALIAAQAKGSFGDPKWGTAREALMNGVWKKGDVTGAKKKFRALRREVETALLLALRQYLDQSAESGLAVFTSEDSGRLHHWEKWQNSALDAIHANDWKAEKKKNVNEFVKQVDKLVKMEQEAHFCETVFKLLWFEELDERVNSVQKPMDGAFEFVFGESGRQVGGLLEWFGSQRGEGLYWVTGKPGSGKTTLMKHLFRNPRIFSSLEAWSGNTPGITSGFFFWGCGTELQKSPVGLLCSILYESLQDMIFGPLEQDDSVIQWLFADRWNQFTSYGGGLHEFTFAELRRAFELMISDASKKFLFMIDGLDEMDEYSNDLIDMIVSAAKKDNIKFCVSSRLSPVFLSAFERRPRLVLDDWTKNDIQTYITSAFNHEFKLEKLRGKMDGTEEVKIVSTLAEKASGVFLWATLATTFLLLELQDGDDFLILKDRADALPYQLDDLLPHILDKAEITDLEQLWKVHVLLERHSYPSLLPLSFALTAETPATLAADVRPLKAPEITKRIEDMRTLLTQRCKNLFTIFDTSPPEQSSNNPANLKVTYAHRTIRDYLLSQPELFSKIPKDASTLFAEQQWANAHLWTLKTLQPPIPTTAATTTITTPSSSDAATLPLQIWTPLSLALEASLTLFAETHKLPLTYMDAVLTTAIFLHLKSECGSDLPYFPSTTSTTSTTSTSATASPTSLSTSLDLAVLLNLQGYIAIKAKSAERKDIRHAVEFNREVRKRLGRGGEEVWLGSADGRGDGKGKLRGEFGKVRTEVDALLEYYSKVVRFGSVKPGVEVPEWV